jgi:Rrf2 family protein
VGESRTVYALRMLVVIGASKSSQVSLCDASAGVCSPRYAEDIFRLLREADLVCGKSGCRGGYHLARKPDDITVADVMIALSDSFATKKGVCAECMLDHQRGLTLGDLIGAEMRERNGIHKRV